MLSPSFLFFVFFVFLIIFRNCLRPSVIEFMFIEFMFMLGGAEAVVTVVALCAFGIEVTDPLSLRDIEF